MNSILPEIKAVSDEILLDHLAQLRRLRLEHKPGRTAQSADPMKTALNTLTEDQLTQLFDLFENT